MTPVNGIMTHQKQQK